MRAFSELFRCPKPSYSKPVRQGLVSNSASSAQVCIIYTPARGRCVARGRRRPLPRADPREEAVQAAAALGLAGRPHLPEYASISVLQSLRSMSALKGTS